MSLVLGLGLGPILGVAGSSKLLATGDLYDSRGTHIA